MTHYHVVLIDLRFEISFYKCCKSL